MRAWTFLFLCLLVAGCSGTDDSSADAVVETSTTAPQSSSSTTTIAPRTAPEDFLSADTQMCPSGVVAYVFATCPSVLAPDVDTIQLSEDDLQLIEELRKSAGDDINKQIAAAQQISNVVNKYSGDLDVALCGAMQGRRIGTTRVLASRSENKVRIAELIETTCPGNLDLLLS